MSYLNEKAKENAKTLSTHFKLDPAVAYQMTESLWTEARRMILKEVSQEEWLKLSVADKGYICSKVIKFLTDKSNLEDFLNKNINVN